VKKIFLIVIFLLVFLILFSKTSGAEYWETPKYTDLLRELEQAGFFLDVNYRRSFKININGNWITIF